MSASDISHQPMNPHYHHCRAQPLRHGEHDHGSTVCLVVPINILSPSRASEDSTSVHESSAQPLDSTIGVAGSRMSPHRIRHGTATHARTDDDCCTHDAHTFPCSNVLKGLMIITIGHLRYSIWKTVHRVYGFAACRFPHRLCFRGFSFSSRTP